MPANRTTTLILIGLNVFFYLLACGGDPALLHNPSAEILIQWGANLGPLSVTSEPWRLLTGAFLHGSPIHLLANMFVLFSIGPFLESAYGRRRFIALYFLLALGGSLASVWWNPSVLSVGASGALFGLVGAFAAHLLGNRKLLQPEFFQFQLRNLGRFLFYNLLLGVIVARIDQAAHLGGLVWGFVFGLAFIPFGPWPQPWRRGNSRMLAVMLVLLALFAGHCHMRASSGPIAERQAAKSYEDRLRPTFEQAQEIIAAFNNLSVDARAGRLKSPYLPQAKSLAKEFDLCIRQVQKATPQTEPERKLQRAYLQIFVRLRKQLHEKIQLYQQHVTP